MSESSITIIFQDNLKGFSDFSFHGISNVYETFLGAPFGVVNIAHELVGVSLEIVFEALLLQVHTDVDGRADLSLGGGPVHLEVLQLRQSRVPSLA